MTTLAPGQKIATDGDVGRLNWVAARAPALIEKSLGYAPGRLSAGYAILLLAEKLRPNQVEFGGLTLRSGGREGLPLADPEQDERRVRVYCKMVEEYGQAAVDKMREKLADDPRNLSGPERIVKIRPVTRHDGSNPAREYPMGGGGPQYTLKKEHEFLVAAIVGADAVARTAAGWTSSVAEGAPYDGRAKLARYLDTVTAV